MPRASKKKQRSAWGSLLGSCLGGGGGKTGKQVRPGPGPRKRESSAAAVGGGVGQRLSFTDVMSMSAASEQELSVSLVGSNLHVFTVAELKAATQGFLDDNFLGEGGFGPVYKGAVDDKVKPGLKAQPIAVKLWDPQGAQGHKEWLVRACPPRSVMGLTTKNATLT